MLKGGVGDTNAVVGIDQLHPLKSNHLLYFFNDVVMSRIFFSCQFGTHFHQCLLLWLGKQLLFLMDFFAGLSQALQPLSNC